LLGTVMQAEIVFSPPVGGRFQGAPVGEMNLQGEVNCQGTPIGEVMFGGDDVLKTEVRLNARTASMTPVAATMIIRIIME
jgi:hypothetical protein